MLKRRFENLITNLRHQITNAGSESLNAKIQRKHQYSEAGVMEEGPGAAHRKVRGPPSSFQSLTRTYPDKLSEFTTPFVFQNCSQCLRVEHARQLKS